VIGKTVLLLTVWIGLTNSIDPQELAVGAIVSFIIARFFTKDTKINLLSLVVKHLKFTPVFLKNLIKSNIAVAKIVLSPKMKINTGVVKLTTQLEDEYDKLLLANAITLTPGTITLELNDNTLYVHVLNMKSMERDVLQKEIVDEMEKWLR